MPRKSKSRSSKSPGRSSRRNRRSERSAEEANRSSDDFDVISLQSQDSTATLSDIDYKQRVKKSSSRSYLFTPDAKGGRRKRPEDMVIAESHEPSMLKVAREKFPWWQQAAFFAASGWISYISLTVMYGFMWSLFWHQVDPTDLGTSFFVPMVGFGGMIAIPWFLEKRNVLLFVDENMDYLTLIQPICFLFGMIPATYIRTFFLAIGSLSFFIFLVLIYSKPDTNFHQQVFRYASSFMFASSIFIFVI